MDATSANSNPTNVFGYTSSVVPAGPLLQDRANASKKVNTKNCCDKSGLYVIPGEDHDEHALRRWSAPNMPGVEYYDCICGELGICTFPVRSPRVLHKIIAVGTMFARDVFCSRKMYENKNKWVCICMTHAITYKRRVHVLKQELSIYPTSSREGILIRWILTAKESPLIKNRNDWNN